MFIFIEKKIYNSKIKLENGENFKLLGALKCIAGIFKYGKREEVIKFCKKKKFILFYC